MSYVVGAKINAGELLKFQATFDPASLAAVTARDDAITVTGVRYQDDQGNPVDHCIAVMEPDAVISAAPVAANCRVTADNQVTVRFNNLGAGAIDIASGTFTFYIARF